MRFYVIVSINPILLLSAVYWIFLLTQTIELHLEKACITVTIFQKVQNATHTKFKNSQYIYFTAIGVVTDV